MKTNMRNLLYEIEKARKNKTHETFDKLALQIKKICQDFYEETGCTISEISFPIEAIYIIGKEEPNDQVPMMPKIKIRELNL
jgi:hypothetical protein